MSFFPGENDLNKEIETWLDLMNGFPLDEHKSLVGT